MRATNHRLDFNCAAQAEHENGKRDFLSSPFWILALCVVGLFAGYTAEAGLLDFQGAFGSNSLASPWGIAVDSTGIYVMDLPPGGSGASSVVVFDPITHDFTKRFGGDLLGWAPNLAAISNGCLYVLDSNQVRRFDANGQSLGTFGAFNNPWSITLDADANAFIADTWNNQVVKFDPAGNVALTLAPAGAQAFSHPGDVAVTPSGDIIVADMGNKRIETFDANGLYLSSFSTDVTTWSDNRPKQLALGPDGSLYMALGDEGLAVFSSAGTLLDCWPTNFAMASGVAIYGDTLYAVDRGPSGSSGHNRVMVFSIGKPRLSILQGDANIAISWPPPASGWVLQQATTLSAGPSAWSDVATNLYQSDSQHIWLTLTNAASSLFYRLHKQ
jgi:DNA-binding beta-propeller fold protein YncE